MGLLKVLRAARSEIQDMVDQDEEAPGPGRWGDGTPGQQLRQGVRNVRDRLRSGDTEGGRR